MLQDNQPRPCKPSPDNVDVAMVASPPDLKVIFGKEASISDVDK